MSRFESDDEQVQAMKDWWKANGSSLLSGLLVISIAWAGSDLLAESKAVKCHYRVGHF